MHSVLIYHTGNFLMHSPLIYHETNFSNAFTLNLL